MTDTYDPKGLTRWRAKRGSARCWVFENSNGDTRVGLNMSYDDALRLMVDPVVAADLIEMVKETVRKSEGVEEEA